jgi:hypothetical protein
VTTAVSGSCVFHGVYLRGSSSRSYTNGHTIRSVEGSLLSSIDCQLELENLDNLDNPAKAVVIDEGNDDPRNTADSEGSVKQRRQHSRAQWRPDVATRTATCAR